MFVYLGEYEVLSVLLDLGGFGGLGIKCAHACRGQMSRSGILPREPFPCFFETGSFTEPGTHPLS